MDPRNRIPPRIVADRPGLEGAAQAGNDVAAFNAESRSI